MISRPIFHLAFPVKDIPSTLEFYRDRLGFESGLVESGRCIINMKNHQLVAHVDPAWKRNEKVTMYPRHFGIIFDNEDDFAAMLDRAVGSKVVFFQEHFRRFPGTPREHRSFFLRDPSDNLLEFKWYQENTLIFKEATK